MKVNKKELQLVRNTINELFQASNEYSNIPQFVSLKLMDALNLLNIMLVTGDDDDDE